MNWLDFDDDMPEETMAAWKPALDWAADPKLETWNFALKLRDSNNAKEGSHEAMLNNPDITATLPTCTQSEASWHISTEDSYVHPSVPPTAAS